MQVFFRWAVIEYTNADMTFQTLTDTKLGAYRVMAERIARVRGSNMASTLRTLLPPRCKDTARLEMDASEPGCDMRMNGTVYNWRLLKISPVYGEGERYMRGRA